MHNSFCLYARYFTVQIIQTSRIGILADYVALSYQTTGTSEQARTLYGTSVQAIFILIIGGSSFITMNLNLVIPAFVKYILV